MLITPSRNCFETWSTTLKWSSWFALQLLWRPSICVSKKKLVKKIDLWLGIKLRHDTFVKIDFFDIEIKFLKKTIYAKVVAHKTSFIHVYLFSPKTQNFHNLWYKQCARKWIFCIFSSCFACKSSFFTSFSMNFFFILNR